MVSLVSGEDRRKNVYNALAAIDDQIRPALKRKKYVLIKPNTVAVNNQLGSTHADALRGILDYLEGRFRGPVVIADSSKDNTWDAYENFHYDRVLAEYRRAHVRFVDFNEEEKYVVQEIVDRNHHLMQVRLAARLFDPDAFILGSALLKAHDNVVATLVGEEPGYGGAAPQRAQRNCRLARQGQIPPGLSRDPDEPGDHRAADAPVLGRDGIDGSRAWRAKAR